MIQTDTATADGTELDREVHSLRCTKAGVESPGSCAMRPRCSVNVLSLAYCLLAPLRLLFPPLPCVHRIFLLMVSCEPQWPPAHHVAEDPLPAFQAGITGMCLLMPVCMKLRTEHRALCLTGKHSTNQATSQPVFQLYFKIFLPISYMYTPYCLIHHPYPLSSSSQSY